MRCFQQGSGSEAADLFDLLVADHDVLIAPAEDPLFPAVSRPLYSPGTYPPVLHAGRNYLPLGTKGHETLHTATNVLPKQGATYLRAREDLARTDTEIPEARRKVEQLMRQFRPQLVAYRQIEERAGNLYQRLFTLRPRDQIALARVHGRHELEWAARREPEHATRTLDSRQRWMQNLSRELDRALDRRLSRTGLSLPGRHQSLDEWTAQALRRGLHPFHVLQLLTRAGIAIADAAAALSLARAAIRSPAKTALWLTAKALGIPSLAVRMAILALDLVRDQGRSR